MTDFTIKSPLIVDLGCFPFSDITTQVDTNVVLPSLHSTRKDRTDRTIPVSTCVTKWKEGTPYINHVAIPITLHVNRLIPSVLSRRENAENEEYRRIQGEKKILNIENNVFNFYRIAILALTQECDDCRTVYANRCVPRCASCTLAFID